MGESTMPARFHLSALEVVCSLRSTLEAWGGVMRASISVVFIALLSILSAGAGDAPITSNPIPEPILKHGLAVQVQDLLRLPDTRGIRAAEKDVAPDAWGACELRARSPRWPPFRQRLARVFILDRFDQSASCLCRCRHSVSLRYLYAPRKWLYRLRVSSRFRKEWSLLHSAQRDWAGESENARFHSNWLWSERRYVP